MREKKIVLWGISNGLNRENKKLKKSPGISFFYDRKGILRFC